MAVALRSGSVDAREFLTALAEDRTTSLDAGALTRTAFVVGAWLLSEFLPEGTD